MSNLITRTYRFSEETLAEIEWLAARLGGLDATSVLRQAVAELYQRKQAAWKARLVDQGDGSYALHVGERTLARVDASVLDKLPDGEREGILTGEADGLSALALLLLGAAVGDDVVWLSDDLVER
jgi:hypothetical protein